MSVENPDSNVRPRIILPGDKVVVISSVTHEFEHDSLFGECEKNLETIKVVFQGTVKTTPELAADHKGYWEIREVECINFVAGAVRRCMNLVFDGNDMSYDIARINTKQPKDQFSLRIDLEGALQL